MTYFDALEMTAWMGLNEEKRVKYAKVIATECEAAIRKLAEETK